MFKIKKLFSNIGSGMFAFLWLIFVIIFPILLLVGILRLMEFIYPVLVWLVSISLFFSIFILLPLSIFKKLRHFSGIGISIAFKIFSTTLVIWSILLVANLWGFWGIVLGLFLYVAGFVPVALLATLFAGEYSAAIDLIILSIITFGAWFISYKLLRNEKEKFTDDNNQGNSNIDVVYSPGR